MRRSFLAAALAVVLTSVVTVPAAAAVVNGGHWNQKENGAWEYLDERGNTVTGFVTDQGNIYYLDPNEGEGHGELVAADGCYEGAELNFNAEHNGTYGAITHHEHVFEQKTVDVPAVGHYENVAVSTIEHYICGYHGEDFGTLEDFERHALDTAVISPTKLSYTKKTETQYAKQWVEDMPAAVETASVCRICGVDQ